jgi:hypothetical protein
MIVKSFMSTFLNAIGIAVKLMSVPMNEAFAAILNLLQISRGAIDWNIS